MIHTVLGGRVTLRVAIGNLKTTREHVQRAWSSLRAAERGDERPATRLVLEPRPGTIPLSGEVMLGFTPLFFAFGLILAIGCANVANLLLARGVARHRSERVPGAAGRRALRLPAQVPRRLRLARWALAADRLAGYPAAALSRGAGRLQARPPQCDSGARSCHSIQSIE